MHAASEDQRERPRGVLLLGSTGSIGTSTLQIVSDHPGRFAIAGLAAHHSVDRIEAQVRLHRPPFVALIDESAAAQLEQRLRDLEGTVVLSGPEGVLRMIAEAPCDVVVHGISGAAGLQASLAVLERGLPLALANKESLVLAGEILMPLARARGVPIVPVDSEHSAIFQCLQCRPGARFNRIILTGSGGPFRERPLDTFASIQPPEALTHPNWEMGARITIGSATMMNKALEVIEAHHLFAADADRIHVVIHPQSVIHSLVEFEDGSVIAQMGPPDMKVPIHYAMTYPEQRPTHYGGFDAAIHAQLTFEELNPQRFPALALGFEAVRRGGVAPAVLNAADEIAVERFLSGEISFPEICRVNERVFLRAPSVQHPSLDQLVEADRWAREEARRC